MSEPNQPDISWAVVFNRAPPPGHRGWGRVRAEQLQQLVRTVLPAGLMQIFNAVALAAILWPESHDSSLILWCAAVMVMVGISLVYADQIRRRAPHSVSRRAIDRISYHATLISFLWTVPTMLFFSTVDHPQQLAIFLVSAATMAGAAFLFASAPVAAAAFVIVTGCAVTSALWRTDQPLISTLGAIYTCGLVVVIYMNGRAYLARKCLDIELEEHSQTVSLLLRDYESSDADWLWQTGRNMLFQNPSPRFSRALGRSHDALEAVRFLDLIDQSGDPYLRSQVAGLFERRSSFSEIVLPVVTSDGVRHIEFSAMPRFNSQGRFLGYRGVGSDVTETRQAADRIEHMARHDMLTGLPNRMRLFEALEQASARATESGGQFALMLLDLDRFKAVNDSLGHVAGDQLLRQVRERLTPLLSPDMLLARLGGDEFALVVPDSGGQRHIEKLGRRIIEAMNAPFDYKDQHLFVGASIGIDVGPTGSGAIAELVGNADLALYAAKENGGNNLRFYDPRLRVSAEERRQLELAMRGALENGEFHLAYQPCVNVAEGRVDGFEALIRWTNPQLGALSPAQFIPIAEETGLIGRIGEWVLRTACENAAKWPGDIGVAVNISPLQLQHTGFMQLLISALSQSGLAPHRLELEITETVFLQISPRVEKVLNQIETLGVRLAIDDFGTGYSSLGYLRETRFDTIKIDRSFIQMAKAEDKESHAVIRAVIALADNLGMRTIAEGVETKAQMELIRQLGCGYIQGHYYSKAIPGREVDALLAKLGTQAAA